MQQGRAGLQSKGSPPSGEAIPRRADWRIGAGLLFLYLVWGSSYLGNSIALHSFPPFVLVSLRYMSAGLVLYALSRHQGATHPPLRGWVRGSLLGVLMIGFTQGAIIEAQKELPSGLVALILATLPLWTVILGALLPPRRRPGPATLAGLTLGLLGTSLLLGGESTTLARGPMLLVCLGALSWAGGILLAPHCRFTPSTIQAAGMQMLLGGGAVLLYGLATDQWPGVDPQAVSPASWLAFGFLVIFPSILAYPVYNWLLGHTDPAKVATFAFVNPVVAMALGWLVLNEPVTPFLALCALLMVLGVACITLDGFTRRRGARP